MNAKLKRMFEDKDCSREEAELHAAILGKTYEECRAEWSRQFKKEFILANNNIIIQFNYAPDSEGKIHFKLRMEYYSDLMNHMIMRCDNVVCDGIPLNTNFDAFRIPSGFNLTITFFEHELDAAFMDAVRDKIKHF